MGNKKINELSKEEFDKLWIQFEYNTNLYKFYFNLFIQINLFYYGITGGILTFFFANNSILFKEYILCLPILISIAFIIFFWIGSNMIKVINEDILKLSDELNLDSYPDTSILRMAFRISSYFYTLIAFFLIFLFFPR